MIIAAAAAGADPELIVDSRFGRAPLFLVYDTENERYSQIENTQQLESAQGAGIQSAQHIAESGASVLICRHCGPKAFKVLKAAGVAVCTVGNIPVSKSVAAYIEGNLEPLEEADVEGHWI